MRINIENTDRLLLDLWCKDFKKERRTIEMKYIRKVIGFLTLSIIILCLYTLLFFPHIIIARDWGAIKRIRLNYTELHRSNAELRRRVLKVEKEYENNYNSVGYCDCPHNDVGTSF